MKAKKRVKGSSSAHSTSDTSRWESLLAGGGNGGAALSFTLGSRISALTPGLTTSKPKATENGGHTSAALSTKLSMSGEVSTKRREQAIGIRGSFVKTSDNWKVLCKRDTSARAASENLPDPVDGADSVKGKKRKNNKKDKNVGSSSGIANPANNGTSASHDFFVAKKLATSPSFKDKKRQRSSTGASGGCSNSKSGGPPNAVDDRQSHPNRRTFGVRESSADRRPRSNVLNIAFQAQKKAGSSISGALEAKARRHDRHDRGKGGGKGRGAEQSLTAEEQAQYVGLDCEMVGVGPSGCRSALARCCMVDWDGTIIYDKHVTPNERVTDFRTFVSGVQAKHLKGGLTLRECQAEVMAILKDKVLVGHALHNDLKALLLTHPRCMTRDTATYRPYQKAHGRAGGKLHPKSLKSLSMEHLNRTIQKGQHHPAEDARAAIDLYKLARHEWEKSLSAAVKMRRGRTVVNQQAPSKKLKLF